MWKNKRRVLTSSCKQINLSAVLCYTFLAMRVMQTSSGAGQHNNLQRQVKTLLLDGLLL